MNIPRAYSPLAKHVIAGRVLILFGPRRVGKTTLLQEFLSTTKERYRLVNGEDISVHEQLRHQRFSDILDFAEGYDLIAIDEAQATPNIGMALKIMVDQRPDLRIIATGSSSFDLMKQVGEPLTGRKRTLTLYPIAQLELLAMMSHYDLEQMLPTTLVYGSYPSVIAAKTPRNKRAEVLEITNSYLLKDVLAFEGLQNSQLIHDLLKLLALQMGSQVSLHEIGTKLGLHVATVQRYIDILEKTFVIWRLGSLSRNARNEVRKSAKYYFYDNGIRNALIEAFQPLDKRDDVGALWEAFVLNERRKRRAYRATSANEYFWRLYSGAEIDYVEEYDGVLHGLECKWNSRKTVKPPASWSTAYPASTFDVITPENYLDFVT